MEQEESGKESWKLPENVELEKKPNFLLYGYKIWWVSLLISVLLWGGFMIFYAREDSFWDSIVFGLYAGLVFAALYTVLFVFLVLPFLAIICYKPKFWLTRGWLILMGFILLGLFGVELTAYITAGESVVLRNIWLTSYGLVYGVLTGVIAIVRKPKLGE